MKKLRDAATAKFGEQLNISLGFVSKVKVEPLMHFAGMKPFVQNLLCKLARRHQREIAPKRQE